MKLSLLLLATLGEWLGGNAIAALGLLLTWLVSLGGLVWKMSKWAAVTEANGERMETLYKAFQSHVDEMDDHVRDSAVHTTFEQRMAINARFDKVEHSISDGHNRIENKIDKLIDWVMKK